MRLIIVEIIIFIGGYADWAKFRILPEQKELENILEHKRKIEENEAQIRNLLISQSNFKLKLIKNKVADYDMNTLYDKIIEEKLHEAMATLDDLLKINIRFADTHK